MNILLLPQSRKIVSDNATYGQIVRKACANFNEVVTVFTTVVAFNIMTTGKPVKIEIIPRQGGPAFGFGGYYNGTGGGHQLNFEIRRNGVKFAEAAQAHTLPSGSYNSIKCSTLTVFDSTPSIGNNSYEILVKGSASSGIYMQNCDVISYEVY